MTPEDLMRRAIALSMEKMQGGSGGPFGAVIARHGEVIAEGWNQVTSSNDPTAHAEVVAIRRACTALRRFDLADCEIFSSCEPCPMCLAAIYWARLKGLRFGNDRQAAAAIGFDDDFLYREVPKPVDERAIPTTQMLAGEARAAFDAWAAKPDKVKY
jgi:tRNA(Arg) A34 adenosine deaminase TadA